jgi:hypothetical protein
MAVTFDAVGPSSAGATAASVTSVSWSHTCSGTNRYVVVGAAVGQPSDTGLTTSATYNAVSMTSLGIVHSGASTSGYVQLWGLINPPTGASTVVVTASVSVSAFSAGSISFNGVDQSTPVGTAVTATANATSVAVSVTGTTTGNMIVDAACYGSGVGISTSTQTNRWKRATNGLTGAGTGGGSTASAGGSVSMSYSASSADFWGIVAVEVKAVASGGSASATVASRSTGVNDTGSTAHTITKPSGLTSTQGVLVCFTNDIATTTATTSSSGWTSLGTQSQGTTTNHTGTVFWAANGATATNLTVDLSTAEEATWAILVINDPGTPEIIGANQSSGTTVNVPTLTTSATGDYLAVVYVGTDASTTTAQTFTAPSGFANTQSQNPGITSSAATFTCERSYTAAASIAPGTATLGLAEQSVSFTIGFPGTVSSGGGSTVLPTIRSVGTGADSTLTSTTLSCSKPPGLAVGDYMLTFQVGDSDASLASMTAPSGFTALASATPNSTTNIPAAKIWGRVATSTEVAASNFTFGDVSSSDDVVIMLAITTGTYDTTTPVTVSSFATSTAYPQSAPSVTGVVNGLLLALFGTDATGTSTSYPTSGPSGMTRVQTLTTPQLYATAGIYSQALTSTAATGTRSVTPSPSNANGSASAAVIINPGTSSGGTAVDTTDFFFANA